MRCGLLVMVPIVLVLAGCSGAEPDSGTSDHAAPHGTPAAGSAAPTSVQHVAADLSYQAWIYECSGPFAILAWDYLKVDVSHAVAADLNFTWKANGPLDNGMVFGFTRGPNGPIYAKISGASPTRWKFSGDVAQAIHDADRLEPLGPICNEPMPAYAAIDITVHVEGAIWSA